MFLRRTAGGARQGRLRRCREYTVTSASVLRARRGVQIALASASERSDAMSRAGVGLVIETLFTDRDLRIRFALGPMETVADLFLRGFDLTGDEIDLLCRTDAALWFTADNLRAERQH